MRIQPETPAVTMPAHQFTGEVGLEWLSTPQTPEQRAVLARVRFPAGARTVWHAHVRGQTLHVTSGVAWMGTRGGDVVEVHPGQTAYIAGGEEHWHGASPSGPMEHLALLEDGDDPVTATVWQEHVSDADYLAGPTAPSAAAPASAPATASATAPGTHAVPLGAPVFAQALRYTAMYGLRPFLEALLVYLDNGSYKILSPGEEHYGSYVSAAEPTTAPRHVAFLSWPSDDWDRNVASHTLTFDPDTDAFIQALVLPGDPVARAQHGYSATVPDAHLIDMGASWEQLRAAHADVFDALEERVARR